MLIDTGSAGGTAPGALLGPLRAGCPGFAVVRNFFRDAANRLLNMANVLCTPRIGDLTHDECQVQFWDVFDQMLAYAAGKSINLVNPDVLI